VAIVSGILRLKDGVGATCEWKTDSNWVEKAPIVFCKEAWIKTGPPEQNGALSNWHIMGNHQLCYVLNLEWSNFLNKIAPDLSESEFTFCAASYAINNLQWLLNRHLEGFRLGLADWHWPKSWPQWPHSQAGIKAYEKLKQKLDKEIILEK
jgi:hypothetical protein